MREIGGFFEYPEFNCNKAEDSVYYYLTHVPQNHTFIRDGRQAILSVLNWINWAKASYLPAYLCASILQPFKELGLNVQFYGHTPPLKPVINDKIKNSLIFIIDYFGTEAVTNKEIEKLLDRKNIVISDITHSIFSKTRFKIHHENYYLISSLRKVFPIPDGGIVYHTNPYFNPKYFLPAGYGTMVAAMELKALNKDRDYYITLYRSYEEDKDFAVILQQKIPDISIHVLNNLKISNIKKTRTKNLQFLYKNLPEEYLLFGREGVKSPFFLPLVFKSPEQRDMVKEKLIAGKIYPPIHWQLPKEVPEDFVYEWNLSNRILSIPCDQRYGKEDMQRIVKVLNEVI